MLALAMAGASCSYHQIATLTVASTRNYTAPDQYILLGKQVQGKGKEKNHDALERAIDDAVHQYPTGEFMMNVRVYVNGSGTKVKVVGDVMGKDTIR